MTVTHNWATRLLKKYCRRHPAASNGPSRIQLEALEDRLVPVLSAFDVPLPLGPGIGYDGVVMGSQLSATGEPTGTWTGALIQTATQNDQYIGRYVLTAAHNFFDDNGKFDTRNVAIFFDMPAPNGGAKTIRIDVPNANILVPAANDPNVPYNPKDEAEGNDMALIRLPEIAPVGAEAYQLYTGNNEFALPQQTVTYVGYGSSGTGMTGGDSDVDAIQRLTINGATATTSGSFELTFTDGGEEETTAPIAFNADPKKLAESMDTALNALGNVGAGQNVTSIDVVPRYPASLAAPPVPPQFEIVFTTRNSGYTPAQLTFTDELVNEDGPDPTLQMQTTLDATPVAFQSLAVNATAGSFKIQLGSTIQSLPFNASAQQLQTALLALPGIQAVTLTPTPTVAGSAFTISFDQVNTFVYPDLNVPQLQVDTTGLTGTASARVLTTGGRWPKRMGSNQYAGDGRLTDSNGNPLLTKPAYTSRALTADFDSGTQADNVFGDSTGLGVEESFTGRGDSGGPAFINGQIAGIVSFGGTFFGSASSAATAGRGLDTRVSAPAIRSWIQSNAFQNQGVYPVTLNMNDQVMGNDGAPDSIIARVVNGNLQLSIGAPGAEQLAFSGPAASIQSLTLIGSNDAGTFVIDSSVGVSVNITSKSGKDNMVVALASAGARTVTITNTNPVTISLVVTGNTSSAPISASDSHVVQGFQAVVFAGVASVKINDIAPANQINLKPSTATSFIVVGASAPPSPVASVYPTPPVGDILQVDESATSNPALAFTSPGSGSWSFADAKAITFSNIQIANFLPASNRSFVTSLYQSVLYRAPDTAGLDAFVTQLTQGISRLAVAQGFLASAERLSFVVDGYYQQFLGRSESATERAGWVASMQAGRSEESVAVAFVSSAEYQTKNPSPKGFVDQLYIDLLGRTADNDGEAFWVNLLPTLGPAGVANAILNSAESRNHVVASYYDYYLGRTAGASEIQGWTSKLATPGFTFRDVIAEMLASAEYLEKS